MNERLAVEAESVRLAALRRKTFGVAEVVVDAVEDIEAEGAHRGHAGHQPREHWRAAGYDARAGILGEVVGAHDEGGEPRRRIERGGRDIAHIEHGERRL